MTDLFEQRLAERLQAHPLPEPTQALDVTSVALGQRIRRRRIGAVVAVLVLLLAIPGAAGLWQRALNTDQPPVTTPTTPAVPPGPRSLILDPIARQRGPEAKVSSAQGDSVQLASGGSLTLPPGQVGSITEYGAEAAWLVRSGQHLRLNLTAAELPIPAGTSVSGVDPGPDGSVMIRTESGPLIWTRDARLVRPPQQVLRTTAMAAAAHAIWFEHGGQVSRIGASDLTRSTAPYRSYQEWKTLISGDPVADRVVVADVEGCHAMLDGSTGALVWRTCDWEILAVSPDGSLAAARSVQYGTLDLVELASGQLRLRVDADINPVGSAVVFDQDNRLNLRVGEGYDYSDLRRATSYTFVTVDADGDCWLSSDQFATEIRFITPNRL